MKLFIFYLFIYEQCYSQNPEGALADICIYTLVLSAPAQLPAMALTDGRVPVTSY